MGTTPNALPLSDVLNVAVIVSPAAAPGPTFNQIILVGPTDNIPSVGANSRARLYEGLDEITGDGFDNTDPEYLAAVPYFGQTPQPTALWIGRQDLTALQTVAVSNDLSQIATVAIGSDAGTGYLVNDTVSVTQLGASGAVLKVASVSEGGVVTGLSIVPASAGTGYSIATGLATAHITGSGSGLTVNITAINTLAAGTGYAINDVVSVTQSGASLGLVKIQTVGTGGSVTSLEVVQGSQGTGYAVLAGNATTAVTGVGSGLQVDVSTIGETPLQAVQACRIAQPTWYICEFVGTATTGQHQDIASFLEAASPSSVYFNTTGEPAVVNNPQASRPALFMAAKLRRTWTQYATTQGGTQMANLYAASAAAGKAMGMNTGAPGSYFDIYAKPIAVIAPEPLTASQVDAIAGSTDRSTPGLNCNVYVNYQNSYAWIKSAIMASGDFFDEVLNLDMLASDMQISGINLLVSVPALPITDLGMTHMKNVLAGACERAKIRGFIAPSGIWQGNPIGTGYPGAINTGDALPIGYALFSQPMYTWSAASRAARIMPPITCILVEAQSAHSLSVTVYPQR